MSSFKINLIQKSVTNVSKNKLFRHRWVSINSLLIAVENSYDFDDDFDITKKVFGKCIAQMVTSIDNLEVKNDLGMHRGKKRNEFFFSSKILTKMLILSPQ